MNLNGSKDDIPFEILNTEELFRGKWLSAKQVFFRKRDEPRQEPPHFWQIPYRTTRNEDKAVDGVAVIAILNHGDRDGDKSIVLVKQFRIPIMAYSVEFPSGLVDADETPLDAALRELREETGYTASKVLASTTGVQNLDPGLTNDSINVFIVEVDASSPCNQNVMQKLDDTESIEVLVIRLSDLTSKLREFSEIGYQVEASLYTFALGSSLHRVL